jgi:hypothetical protein
LGKRTPAFDFDKWLQDALKKPGTDPKKAVPRSLKGYALPMHREGTDRMAPPPSMLRALSVHGTLSAYGKPLRLTLEASVTVTSELSAIFETDVLTWSDKPSAPALVPLPSGGMDRLYLWMGHAHENGEYPVVVLSDEPDLSVRYPSFAHYLCDAYGCRTMRSLDAEFGTLVEAKSRLKKALAREHIVAVVDVEGPLWPAKTAAHGKPTKRPKATSPKGRSAEVFKALAALRSFENAYTKAYRSEAGAVLANLLSIAEDHQTALLKTMNDTPFVVASVAATALLHVAASARNPGLLADILTTLDAHPNTFNEEWSLDNLLLTKAVGTRPLDCFALAFARSAAAPQGPWFTKRYAKPFLSKVEIDRAISLAVLAAPHPVWTLDHKLSPAARKCVLKAFLPGGYETNAKEFFRDSDPQVHCRELGYALEFGSCSTATLARLERRARELAKAFSQRVGGDDVFGKVVCSAIFREAEKVYPGATKPIRTVVDTARPVTRAAEALGKNCKIAVTEAKPDRFRNVTLEASAFFVRLCGTWGASRKQQTPGSRGCGPCLVA